MFGFGRRKKGADAAPGAAGEPAPTRTEETSHEIDVVSPVPGRLLPLSEVPDPVFSRELVGPGFAVDPVQGIITAPIAGTVVTVPASRHAIGIRGTNGADVLVHVGVDSVNLKGEGLSARCREGDVVEIGDPVLEVDLDLVRGKIPSLLTPVVVTNAEAEDLVVDGPDLDADAGAPVLTIRSR